MRPSKGVRLVSSGSAPPVEVNTLELKIDPKKKEVEMEESASVESPNIGWGRWYSLKELENATEGFAEQNVIGEGGYGIVYKGILMDGSVVAVKNLLNNKYVLMSAFFFFLLFPVCVFLLRMFVFFSRCHRGIFCLVETVFCFEILHS